MVETRPNQVNPIKPRVSIDLSEDQRPISYARLDVPHAATSPPHRDPSDGSDFATSPSRFKYSEKSILN